MKIQIGAVMGRCVCACLVLAAMASGAAAQTKFVKHWVVTGEPVPTFRKLLVIGMTENYIIRQYFEDDMEKRLGEEGAQGIKGHMVLPAKDEMTRDEVIKRIKASPLDAVVIVRPMGVRKEEEYHEATIYPYPTYMGFGSYWNYAYAAVYTPGYMEEHTVARVEINVYNVKNEKLVWSAQTDTFAKEKLEGTAKSLSKAIVKRMKKDGLLPKK